MSQDRICNLCAVDVGAIGRAGIAKMIPARFEEEIGMVARNRGLVDLQNVVRESADRHLLLAKVEVDPVVFGEKNLKLGHLRSAMTFLWLF